MGATSIDLVYNGMPGGTAASAAFTGYVFDFAGAPTITGASLDPASTFTSSQIPVGFTASEVTVNGAGQTFNASSVILVDLTLAGTSAVPEPGTLSLLGAGVVAVGLFRRRKAV